MTDRTGRVDYPERPCAECGATFKPPTVKSTCCSRTCRERIRQRNRTAHRRRPERRCLWCDKAFNPSSHYVTTCSYQCGQATSPRKRLHSKVTWYLCHGCDRPWTAAGGRRCECTQVQASRWSGYHKGELREVSCRYCATTWVQPARQGAIACEPCKALVRSQIRARRRARKLGAERKRYRRFDIFERDGWRCQLCGRRLRSDVVHPHPEAPTIDHIIPLSKGGADAPANVQCACFQCNTLKGDRLLGEGEQLRLIG